MNVTSPGMARPVDTMPALVHRPSAGLRLPSCGSWTRRAVASG